MPLVNCHFYSDCLERNVPLNVYVPRRPHSDGKAGFPVVYLLHGRSGDETSWADHGISWIGDDYGYIMVMPDADRSFYRNMASGQRFWDYVSMELPDVVKMMFQVRTDRESTFAAGLSMGGYGALKLGLTFPERFAKIGVMSSVADIGWAGRADGGMSDEEVAAIFGSRTAMLGTDDDLFELLKRPAPACGRPKLWMSCGGVDPLRIDNQAFLKKAQALNWSVYYEETPNWGHCWDLWMQDIRKILNFFDGK